MLDGAAAADAEAAGMSPFDAAVLDDMVSAGLGRAGLSSCSSALLDGTAAAGVEAAELSSCDAAQPMIRNEEMSGVRCGVFGGDEVGRD